MRRLLWPILVLALLSGGCDHATKQIAHETLAGAPPIHLLGSMVRLELVENPGAFLSLGARLPEPVRFWLFRGLVPLCLLAGLALALRSGFTSRLALAGLGLVAGGGLANWLDRVLNDGAVTDFVSLSLGPLRTGIFNAADVWVVLGIALLVLARPPRETESETEDEAAGEPSP